MTRTGASSPNEPHRCGSCGAVLPPRQRPGRPSAYCSNACRQKAFRKRHATQPESARESNLPQPLDAFVGRAAELATVRETLRTARLLTITGAGGAGKSRLAVEALRRSPGEVRWVGLRDGMPFREAVAAGFGLPADGELGRALVSAIGGRRSVLFFDECEHVLEPCAELIAELLRGCPSVRVVTTSREPLRIPGEKVVRIAPLPVPGRDRHERAEVLAFDAVRLFVNRAQDTVACREFSDDELACAVRICRELDGLPMAIELAARHVESLPVNVIEHCLRGRLELLTGELRGSGPRTRHDLRGTFEWSHALLTGAERTVLRRLAICQDSFSVAAAQAICAGGDIARRDVLGLLLSLNAKSMVERVDGADARFRLLEPVRWYAREQLVESGEAPQIVARGVDWLVPLVQPLITGVCVPSEVTEVLCAEQAHLENAIESDVDDPDTRVLLATGLAWAWQHHGRSEAAHGLLTTALAQAPRSRYRAAALVSLSWHAIERGLQSRARRYAIDAVRAAHEERLPQLEARALRQLALTHLGSERTSVLMYRRALDSVSHPREVAVVRQELAWALVLCGRSAEARAEADLALPEFSAGTHEHAAVLCTIAAASIVDRRWEDARVDLVEALGELPSGDFIWPYVVEGLGVVAERTGDVPTAALLFAAAEASRDNGAAVAGWPALIAPSLARVRENLSERNQRRAWRRGGAMPPEEVISLVRREEVVVGGRLTPREQQVVAMLADGLTNRQIALRMGITTRTVANHLDHLKRKLGLGTRALVMRWYLEQQS